MRHGFTNALLISVAGMLALALLGACSGTTAPPANGNAATPTRTPTPTLSPQPVPNSTGGAPSVPGAGTPPDDETVPAPATSEPSNVTPPPAAPCADLVKSSNPDTDQIRHAVAHAIAASMTIEFLPGDTKTHYGHEAPGKELDFKAQVIMGSPSYDVIMCATQVGITVPQPGPLANVIVQFLYGGLDQYGQVQEKPNPTGNDGIAALIFQPKNEVIPYFGDLKNENGTLGVTDATYNVQSDKGPMAVVIQSRPTVAWTVERHAPAGFKLTNMKLHIDYHSPQGVMATNDLTISGHVCGEDPTKPMEVQQHWEFQTLVGIILHRSGDDTATWTFGLSGGSPGTGGLGGSTQQGVPSGASLTIIPNNPPVAVVDISNPVLTGHAQQILEDDKDDCPPPQ
jgi:hypothetical protein